jgi:hypothetical protein
MTAMDQEWHNTKPVARSRRSTETDGLEVPQPDPPRIRTFGTAGAKNSGL